MTLIQKLPLGITLACCMMMSSCSQEDVQVAQPQSENLLTDASSKANALAGGGQLGQLPSIAITEGGNDGAEAFPAGWLKLSNYPADGLPEHAAGTSSLSALWGNSALPWIKPLSSPDGNANSVVTFLTQKNASGQWTTQTFVRGKIKNLIPGQKYKVTLSLASTIVDVHGYTSQYARKITVMTPGVVEYVDMVGKEATWVTKTIVFEAQSKDTILELNATVDKNWADTQDNYLHYAHVHVGSNAIVKL